MIATLHFLFINFANSQPNLIPNPDFEEVDPECYQFNNSLLQIQFPFFFLSGWLPIHYEYFADINYYQNIENDLYYYGTPDFYHPCVPLHLNCNSLINNKLGYQMPFNGIGYAGIGIYMGHYHPPYCDYSREFIRIELKDTLKQGQGYCFRLHYSLANISNRVASHLGAVFSTDSFPLNKCGNYINEVPEVFSEHILCEDLDTTNWHVLEGNFKAEGKEQWLTIGWFHHLKEIYREKTNFPNQMPDSIMAYYTIDGVELYECPQYGVPDYEIRPPNVISANGDGLNDAFFIHPYLPQQTSLVIYNRWGVDIYRSGSYDQSWQGTTADGTPVAEGTYFYVLQLPNGTIKKGTVNVFR